MTIEGQQLGYGRYRLLNLIARSSTSEIYLADDTQISRQVVIKVFLPENSVYPSFDATKWGSRLLLREAEVITKFNHPHILAFLGYGEEVVNGVVLVYLVLRSLHTITKEAPMTTRCLGRASPHPGLGA